MSRKMTRTTWKIAGKEKIQGRKQDQEQQVIKNTTGMSRTTKKEDKNIK